MAHLFESMKFQQEERGQKMQKMEELEKTLNSLKTERENYRESIHKKELTLQDIEHNRHNLFEKMTFCGFVIDSEDTVSGIDVRIVFSEEEERKKSGEIDGLEQKIKYLGAVDLQAIDEYNEIDIRYVELNGQKEDLERAKESLNGILEKTDKEAKEIFLKTFDAINKNFDEMIQTLFGGGNGELRLLPGSDVLETGVEISVKRPGKKHQKLYLLSGGEKSLVGIALVFSMLRINPSPFYILDEVDAALDDYNAERLKNLIEKNRDMAQFIVITHNKLIMEGADILYGITQSMGISMAMAVELEKYAVS
jgi:chromosome segregation protein